MPSSRSSSPRRRWASLNCCSSILRCWSPLPNTAQPSAKQPVSCTSEGRRWTTLALVGPPARLHLRVGARVVHLRRPENDDLGPVGARLEIAPDAPGDADGVP